MSPTTTDPLQWVLSAVRRLEPDSDLAPSVERPKKAEFGDYSTNAALLLAPRRGEAPRAVAEELAVLLEEGEYVASANVAGPGFLNLVLTDEWYAARLRGVLADEGHGGGGAQPTERQNVEFVSANPTGPVHLGHARNAAYGDALARILAFHGHEVTREYYVNDAGSQVAIFGASIRARARGEDVGEDGYKGEYVAELAASIDGAADMDPAELGRAGVRAMIETNRATLERFGARFDVWFLESRLYEDDPSEVDRALATLREGGHLYEREGALWARTTTFGDDKDRVVRRSTGEYTYFASDIAYHWDKRERGFQRCLDVWGADHHGYVTRVKAAYQALGGDPGELELLIMQFVHLVSRGERSSMSKRAGEFVTLDDLVGEVGLDAARWFLLHRSHDTTVDFDLDLAVEESKQNPVYYVQYAHARIASLLRNAGEVDAGAALPHVELQPHERALIQRLLAFPAEVATAAERRAPHRIATYALDLAQDFSLFYDNCPILKDDVPQDVRTFRLALSVASQRTIARALDLLGVSAPESM